MADREFFKAVKEAVLGEGDTVHRLAMVQNACAKFEKPKPAPKPKAKPKKAKKSLDSAATGDLGEVVDELKDRLEE